MNAREKTRMYAEKLKAENERKAAAGIIEKPLTREIIDAQNLSKEEKMWRNQLNSVSRDLGRLCQKAEELKEEFCSAKELDPNGYFRKVDSFIRACQSNYQAARRLYCYERIFIKKEVKPNSPVLDDKAEFDFPSNLEKEGNVYTYTLPELCNKRVTGKPFSELKSGLLIELMRTINEKYMEEHGVPEIIYPAALVFEHHIDRSLHTYFVPDPDNIDIKTVIDEVQLFLISNDSLRVVTLMQYGVEDEKSYTKFYVMPKNELPNWLEKQQNFH